MFLPAEEAVEAFPYTHLRFAWVCGLEKARALQF
jgi:hypothetical protein